MINTKKILAIFTSVCLVTTMFFPVFSFAQIDNANTKEIGEKPTVETNWSEIDWDSRMTLPSDQEAYNEQARELEREMDYGGVKTLVLGKSRISDDDSMEEMEVPEEVRVLVREYRDGLGIYAKKSAKSKKVLKSRISYVYPQEEREVISDIKAIDVSKEKLLNIKQENLHGVKNIDEAEVNVAIKRVIDGPKSKFDLSKFTLPKIKENAGKAIFQNRVEEKELGFWGKVKAFFTIKTAQAEIVTPIIEYYEGIEDNQLDLLLYYVSESQNEDGSFGEFDEYMTTSEAVLMLSSIGRTSNDQYALAIDYLRNAEVESIRDKAVQARVYAGIGEPYTAILDEIVSYKNEDHGYGLYPNYNSDLETTMQVALAMYVGNYSIQGDMPLALFHVLNRIPENGELRYETDSNPSYFLVNNILQHLQPFEELSVGNEGVNITVQSRIDRLLGFLSFQYDDEEEIMSNYNTEIDNILTLLSWERFDDNVVYQDVLKRSIFDNQHYDGSFTDVRSSIFALQCLATVDLQASNLVSTGSLVNGTGATFSVNIHNGGYKTADDAVIYIFTDNFYSNLTVDFAQNGLSILPGQTMVLSLAVDTTINLIGETEIKMYFEGPEDIDYSDNWVSENFTFASDGIYPALPLYFMSMAFQSDTSFGIVAKWDNKDDPNRDGYIVMWKEKGTSAWQMYGLPNSEEEVSLHGGFNEGTTYEVSVGALYDNGQLVRFHQNFTEVTVSNDETLNTGTVRGFATNNEDQSVMDDEPIHLQGGIPVTDENGDFIMTDVPNGSNLSYVTSAQFDKMIVKHTVTPQVDKSVYIDPIVRVFTRLEPDTEAPIINYVEVRWLSGGQLKNQKTYELYADVEDNVSVMDGSYYLWLPDSETWQYIGSVNAYLSGTVLMDWYVNSEFLGDGYKVKLVAYDYQGNYSEEVTETFSITDGTPPTVELLSPNGGEEWEIGSEQTVTWEASGEHAIDKIQLIADYNGIAGDYITSNTTNTGSYTWQIPDGSYNAGDNVVVRIKARDGVNQEWSEDVSDEAFEIIDPSPKPDDPFGYPELQAELDGNDIIDVLYDSQGVMHYYLSDTDFDYGPPRIRVEKILHIQKNLDGSWSDMETVYEETFINEDGSADGLGRFAEYKVEIDSNDVVHFVWELNYDGYYSYYNQFDIAYMSYDGVNTSEIEYLDDDTSKADYSILYIDNSDNVYIGWKNGFIYTEEDGRSGWPIMNVVKKDNQGNFVYHDLIGESIYSGAFTLAVKNDQLHLAFHSVPATLYHSYKENDIWQGWEIHEIGLYQYFDMEFDALGNLHFVFDNYYPIGDGDSRNRVMYRKFDGQSWLEPVEISDTIGYGPSSNNPKIMIDANNNPHVVYLKGEGGISEVKWTTVGPGGNWIKPQTINSVSHNVSDKSYRGVISPTNQLEVFYETFYARSEQYFMNTADLNSNYLGLCEVPVQGDWVITNSCTLTESVDMAGSVEVRDDSVLTIVDSVYLGIDLDSNNLTVRDGSGVLIKSGAKLYNSNN